MRKIFLLTCLIAVSFSNASKKRDSISGEEKFLSKDPKSATSTTIEGKEIFANQEKRKGRKRRRKSMHISINQKSN